MYSSIDVAFRVSPHLKMPDSDVDSIRAKATTKKQNNKNKYIYIYIYNIQSSSYTKPVKLSSGLSAPQHWANMDLQ